MYIVTVYFGKAYAAEEDFSEYFDTWHAAMAWMVEYAQSDTSASSWQLWSIRRR